MSEEKNERYCHACKTYSYLRKGHCVNIACDRTLVGSDKVVAC